MNITETPARYTDTALLNFLGMQESQDIHWGDRYEDDLVDYLLAGPDLTGATLPWAGTHDKIRLRPGEVTIVAGINGHYKSAVMGQILQWIALQGERCGVMSFEMPINVTQSRMVKQAAGTKHPAEQFARQWSRWNHERIAYYDKLDTTSSSKVLGALYYMAQELGCKHIMIDSLTKCGLPYGERAAEKDFIDALCATAKVFGIHIYLVAHVRKPPTGGEEYIPTKFDVRGAGELTDLCHNVWICWADKNKKRLTAIVDKYGYDRLSEKDRRYLEKASDQRLIVAKQRNGEFEGTIQLDLHDSMHFYEPGKRLAQFDMKKLEIVA